jgi:hypothetical protein
MPTGQPALANPSWRLPSQGILDCFTWQLKVIITDSMLPRIQRWTSLRATYGLLEKQTVRSYSVHHTVGFSMPLKLHFSPSCCRWECGNFHRVNQICPIPVPSGDLTTIYYSRKMGLKSSLACTRFGGMHTEWPWMRVSPSPWLDGQINNPNGRGAIYC